VSVAPCDTPCASVPGSARPTSRWVPRGYRYSGRVQNSFARLCDADLDARQSETILTHPLNQIAHLVGRRQPKAGRGQRANGRIQQKPSSRSEGIAVSPRRLTWPLWVIRRRHHRAEPRNCAGRVVRRETPRLPQPRRSGGATSKQSAPSGSSGHLGVTGTNRRDRMWHGTSHKALQKPAPTAFSCTTMPDEAEQAAGSGVARSQATELAAQSRKITTAPTAKHAMTR